MHAFFSGFHRRSHGGNSAARAARATRATGAAAPHPHGRSLLAELALGFTPYLLVLAAVLLVGR